MKIEELVHNKGILKFLPLSAKLINDIDFSSIEPLVLVRQITIFYAGLFLTAMLNPLFENSLLVITARYLTLHWPNHNSSACSVRIHFSPWGWKQGSTTHIVILQQKSLFGPEQKIWKAHLFLNNMYTVLKDLELLIESGSWRSLGPSRQMHCICSSPFLDCEWTNF